MIDFTKCTLQELRAIAAVMDDFMREDAKGMGSWIFSEYVRSTAREAFRAESAAIDQQARDAEQAPELTVTVTRRKPIKVDLSSLYGTMQQAEVEQVDRIVQACVAGAPPVEEPDEHSDLRALVNILSRCSDQLTALALVEDRHFEESSEMDAFIKSTVLRNANRSIIDMLSDIRDHYREVLSDD